MPTSIARRVAICSISLLCFACTDDAGGQTDSTSESDAVESSTDSDSDTETGGPLPDVGPAPDEFCPNPGPWPLPSPPELPELPRFVEHSYIDLVQIGWMSKFRSSIGHDYSDAFEHCRSMKHYAYPLDGVDWSTVEIYAPVAGEVISVEAEWAGMKVVIRSSLHPDIDFMIFHINLMGPLAVGATVEAGELLGTHIGDETYSDIAVFLDLDGPDVHGDPRLVSVFELMSDGLLAEFQARGGVTSPSDIIITQAERDAMALCCTDMEFDDEENLDDWVALDDANPLPPERPGLERAVGR